MTGERRNGEPGDALREGVRSVMGILGALKDAVEQSFEDLRESAERTPERARDAARSTVQHARETVEEARDRFDFVPRRDHDRLREEVERLAARVRALEEAAGIAPAREPVGETPAPDPGADGGSPPPPEERPFRIDSE